MVAGFRRSLSFPNPNHNRPSNFHVRSASLPCISHPLISQLKNEINELTTWGSKSDNRTSAWLCDGLSRLRSLHDSFDDILQLPQTQDSLRRSHRVEKLLEDFLRFVDVYGIFQTSVLGLKEQQSAAQVAIRKRDESKIDSYVKAQKRMAKEMGKLVSTVRCTGWCSVSVSDGTDAELVGILNDVNEVTVLVSVALFNGITASFTSRKSSWKGLKLSKRAKRVKVDEGIKEFQQVGVESLWGLKKRGDEDEVKMALKRMHELEGCIGDMEGGSERVFRCLINTRVSLLNILTQ